MSDHPPVSEIQEPELSDWTPWVAREACRSPLFFEGIRRLRALASRPHPRTTGPLRNYTWGALAALLEEGPVKDAGGVPARAWRNPRESEIGGGYSYEHVLAYRRGCSKVAGRFLGSKDQAPAVHDLVREGEASLPLSGRAAPRDAVASSVAASISGASWGSGATACQQARYEHQPPSGTWPPGAGEGFSLHVRLDAD